MLPNNLIKQDRLSVEGKPPANVYL